MSAQQVPLWRRVRAVTLTAESLRLYNDPGFAAWAEGHEATREQHNGQIKPSWDIDQTFDWLLKYMAGKPCPLDVLQMQDVIELADFDVPGFVADGTWGDFSVASVEKCRGEGYQLYQTRPACADCGGYLDSKHHADQCTTGACAGDDSRAFKPERGDGSDPTKRFGEPPDA
ncbi:MAG TPA: hypothetical protein VI953_04930 [Candidatus Paceibacterota bacterium]